MTLGGNEKFAVRTVGAVCTVRDVNAAERYRPPARLSDARIVKATGT
jgi:hypothetical protein